MIEVLFSRKQLVYFPCLALSGVFLFLKGGVYAKLLSVPDFGELSKLFLIISVLTTFGAVGMQLLGHKMLPMYHARREKSQVASLLAAALALYLAVTVVLGVIATIAALFWRYSSELELWLVLAEGVSQFSVSLVLIDLKSRLNFIGNAVGTLFRSGGLLVIGALAAWWFRNILWVLAAETIVNLMVVVALFAGSRALRSLWGVLEFRGLANWMRTHIWGALRLVILDVSTLFLFSVDKWSGFFVLDNRQYGIYALGLIVLTTFEMLQRMVNVAAYPTMSYMIGRGDCRSAYRIAVGALVLTIGGSVLLYVPGVVAVNYLIDHFLTKYVEAKLVIDILIIAGILRFADFFTTYCILCDRELQLSRFQSLWSAAVVVLVVGLYFTHALRFTPLLLAWIALGTSLLSIVTSVSLAVWVNVKQGLDRCRAAPPGV